MTENLNAMVEIIKALDENLEVTFSRRRDVLFVKVFDPATNFSIQKGISSLELTKITSGPSAGLASVIVNCKNELRAGERRIKQGWRCDYCGKHNTGRFGCEHCGSNVC